ncbi:MAG: prolyl oligopeptidase family serine peptidase [Bacteroidota bacterium]|nr:prolyl oligopeptidase family serine peptidase [Bacteroidota bacterium]
MKIGFTFLLLLSAPILFAQKPLAPLTVEKIMRDPKWIGSSPSNPYWSADGRYLFFLWNPDKAVADSLYYITLTDRTPRKANYDQRQKIPSLNSVVYNASKTAYAFTRDGDLFYVDAAKGEHRITQTTENESSPQFVEADTKIAFTRSQNVYAWDITTGSTIQFTNFTRGTAPKETPLNAQEKWLQQETIAMSTILQERKERRDSTEAINKRLRPKELRTIYTEDKIIAGITVSPDARFITYRLIKQATNAKGAIIPNYITETGFTTDIPGRTKVGAPGTTSEAFVFDRTKDTVLLIKTDAIPGIADVPDFVKDYPSKDTTKKKAATRTVTVFGPYWNSKGTGAVVDIRSADNKDRWLMTLDAATANLKLLDRQRDEAWIAGPGISSVFSRGQNNWIDDQTFWYQSEATGYSHLYEANVITGEKKAITSGKFEVQSVQLSKDKKYFYLTTNEVHPGEQQFYRIPVSGGNLERITTQFGANQVSISPDEKKLAILYSYSNKPWELYLQPNKPNTKAQQITDKAESEEFKSYAWKDPEIITITARDGAQVYARLFRSVNAPPSKPAVIFVHGAGYLQNAHKWWSLYFREYMFNNLLADNGYTVLDMDYRGSAGYGRDWRTGIYRFMGGKDLTDQVDGAKYLIEKLGVNQNNIGIYGGSYGGFITLMAMFKEGNIFKSGAALRSVTDWAHYNDGYTSAILNDPYADSIAYKKSSPIYYAEGLKGNLLMCHGMVDVNVHFQDIVRLTQRLIELGKDHWELAVYPVEDHGFVEPSSWTDEYKRVFALFERTLK